MNATTTPTPGDGRNRLRISVAAYRINGKAVPGAFVGRIHITAADALTARVAGLPGDGEGN